MSLKSEKFLGNENCFTLTNTAFGNIIVDNGMIQELGEGSRGREIDCSSFHVMPGFINSHTHCSMTFLRDLAHGVGSPIENLFFKTEKQLTGELTEAFSYSYLVNAIKTGTTTIFDHYYHIDGVAKACERVGMRAFVGETLADLGGAFPSFETINSVRDHIENWKYSDLIKPVICPHASDTVSKKLALEISSLAKSYNVPLHFHLSQTKTEYDKSHSEFGVSPVKRALEHGWFDQSALAVHLLYVDDEDLKILRDKNVYIGSCPVSQIIYEKLAPIDKFYKNDLNMCLGTDCASSNDQANMIGELRSLALLMKDRGIQSETLYQDCYDTISVNPANYLNEKIGAIKQGYKADLIFVKRNIENTPVNDPITNTIFSLNSHHIKHSMINGQWVMWNQEMVSCNEADLLAQYSRSLKKICLDV